MSRRLSEAALRTQIRALHQQQDELSSAAQRLRIILATTELDREQADALKADLRAVMEASSTVDATAAWSAG